MTKKSDVTNTVKKMSNSFKSSSTALENVKKKRKSSLWVAVKTKTENIKKGNLGTYAKLNPKDKTPLKNVRKARSIIMSK